MIMRLDELLDASIQEKEKNSLIIIFLNFSMKKFYRIFLSKPLNFPAGMWEPCIDLSRAITFHFGTLARRGFLLDGKGK